LEQPLPPNGVCNLGSLDLSKFITKNKETDVEKLEYATRLGVRFLDRVVDKSSYPTEEILKWAKNNRAIGLGIFGFADYCLMKEIAYGSEESLKELDLILSKIYEWAKDESEKLGKELGVPKECKKLPEPRRNITLTTVAPTGCQKPQTLIETDNGLLRLSEIVNVNSSKWQDINVVVHQDNKKARSTKGFINGKANTKKIKLSSGIELECTPNHQYKIIRNGAYNWYLAEDLMQGDMVPCKIGGYNKTSEPSMVKPSYIQKKNGFVAKELTFPEKMNPDLAFFLGCFYADGSVHKKGVRISQNPLQKEKIERIQKNIKKVFGYDAIAETGHTCIEINFSSVKLLSYLKENGILKEKSPKVEIPRKIREASLESLRAFIDGYFVCDGCESGSGYIDTSSYQMAQDLGVSLRAIGKNINIYKSKNTILSGHKGKNPMYRIHFNGYGSSDFPKEKERYISTELKFRYETAKELVGENFIADTIDSISDGKSDTYDISVPDGNCYIAQGVLSHNTVSLIGGASSGIEPIFSEIVVRNDKTGTYVFEEKLADKPYFRCAVSANGAQEVTWEEHVKVLATAQKNVDSGVSKTINFPTHTHRETIAKAIFMAWEMGCKGIAVYRNGSRKQEVLSPKNIKQDKCPNCDTSVVTINNIKTCPSCGWKLKTEKE
jgi:ribonucleotide reductase alpha subunit